MDGRKQLLYEQDIWTGFGQQSYDKLPKDPDKNGDNCLFWGRKMNNFAQIFGSISQIVLRDRNFFAMLPLDEH